MAFKYRGFTLIELMVTIFVIAIIAVIAVPSFNQMIQKNQLKVELRELSAILSQARSNAVLTRKVTKVNLDQSGTNDELTFFWKPSGNLVYKSSIADISFNSEGTVVGFTSDIDLSICHSKLSLQKTIALTRVGTLLEKAEGACT